MKPKISLVCLTVADMGRAVRFYRALGFPTHNYADGDDFAMFRLEGTRLSLAPRVADALARLASLSHNEPSPEAVDAVYAEAIAVGATPVIPPRKAPWGGYEACFADPDGHHWDIAFNPFTDLT